MSDLPSYQQLLDRDDAPAGSSWGLWGADDVLGCLNLATPERALRGAGLVREGRSFGLNLDLATPDPPLYERAELRHEVISRRSGASDEELSGFNTQASSQWDGFRHVRSQTYGHYNGLEAERHGVHHWARHGIVTRGVLADIGRWRAAQGRPLRHGESDPYEPEELQACLAEQGVAPEPGDVLIINTGWLTWYRSLDAEGRAAAARVDTACGLRGWHASAALLWDWHVAAVATDAPGFEVSPLGVTASEEQWAALRADRTLAPSMILHASLLPLLGMPIGELWDLDELADDCAADGVYEFLFTSAPLNLNQGVATPPNALAVK